MHYHNSKCTQMHCHMAYITRLMKKHEWNLTHHDPCKISDMQETKNNLCCFVSFSLFCRTKNSLFNDFLPPVTVNLVSALPTQIPTSGCCSMCCDQINHEFPSSNKTMRNMRNHSRTYLFRFIDQLRFLLL